MILSRPDGTLARPALSGWVALVLFAVLTFLPALSALPVTDRDEARFVQASRQMVQSDDYVDIRFQDTPRYKKPVGIYWLQSAAVLASGQGAEAPLWVYRLPSFLGAVLSVLLVAVVGAPLFGRPAALLAAAVFAGGLVIGGEARLAKTDAALLATILVTQAVLARLYLRQAVGLGGSLAFWLAIAAGTLIKGPIGPMVPALTVATLAALDRRLDWLRPILRPAPIVLALAVTLPWFVIITLRSDGAFWLGSVGSDLLPKIAAGQEGKGAPPGTYLVAALLTFWPAPPLLILSLPAIWLARREAPTRFLLAWAVPLWLVYEAIPTKLIHYTLPALPALALIAVGHLPAGIAQASRWLRGLAGLAVLPGLALGLAVAAYVLRGGNLLAAGFACAGLAGALVATALALQSWKAARPWALAAYAALAGAMLHAGLISAAARIPALWPTDQAIAIAMEIAAAQGCPRPTITGWGYSEPSLVWRGGTDTRLFPAETPAADVIHPQQCSVVIRARDNDEGPFAMVKGCRPAGTITGLAIGAGRNVTLDILDCGGG